MTEQFIIRSIAPWFVRICFALVSKLRLAKADIDPSLAALTALPAARCCSSWHRCCWRNAGSLARSPRLVDRALHARNAASTRRVVASARLPRVARPPRRPLVVPAPKTYDARSNRRCRPQRSDRSRTVPERSSVTARRRAAWSCQSPRLIDVINLLST